LVLFIAIRLTPMKNADDVLAGMEYFDCEGLGARIVFLLEEVKKTLTT